MKSRKICRSEAWGQPVRKGNCRLDREQHLLQSLPGLRPEPGSQSLCTALLVPVRAEPREEHSHSLPKHHLSNKAGNVFHLGPEDPAEFTAVGGFQT